MNSEFVSFKDWLSNDSALATRIPYTDKPSQLENVTNCTAIENGWVWNIPLWNRVGTGYVIQVTLWMMKLQKKNLSSI